MVELVTSTRMVHDPFPGTEPSLSSIIFPPAGADSDPPQSVKTFGGLAIVTPAGNLSANLSPRIPDGDSFPMVNVRVLMLPGPIVSGEKLLAKDGTSCPAMAGALRSATAPAKIARARTPPHWQDLE